MNDISYSEAFQEGQSFTLDIGEITFTTIEVGKLVLTSGKLVACDPLTLTDSQPFTANLEPGTYPVLLSIAHIKKNNQPKQHAVAYAMIRLSQEWSQPLTWEIACHSSQNPAFLKEEEFFGYGVDSGTGGFMDADVATMLDDSIYVEEEEENLVYQLQHLLENEQMLSCSWANMCVDKKTQANVIAFSSGWGDGIYPTYFGVDIGGKVASVVTDFGVCPKLLLQI